jgi:hypothetical protein
MQAESWRDHILKEFAPQAARLTLVADPDGLLLEERVLQTLRERGFDLIAFEDPIAFRFAYESKYRSHWDRGEPTDLVVVLRSGERALGSLPWDLLQAGRQMRFSLTELFPNLSYPVVAALDRADLDPLFEAQRHLDERRGDNGTKDFVLEHVFGISAATIKKPSDLLRMLLRRHYQRQRIPAILDDRLVQLLRQSGRFDEWPLEFIVADREAFLRFLQERWPIFVRSVGLQLGDLVVEPPATYRLEFTGPAQLPFDHNDVRVFVDNLFVDGVLHPIENPNGAALAQAWVSVGLRVDATADRARRLERLITALEHSLPQPVATHHDWLAFAPRWAELRVLQHERPGTETARVERTILALQQKVDDAFTSWVRERYAGLHNQPPAMVHHLPRLIARHLQQSADRRAALIVADGLAWDQWVVLREEIARQAPQLRFHESALFAWLPTLTSVSRQAVFAGTSPLYFPASIYSTAKESALWARFWVDQGLSQNEVEYAKGLGEPADLAVIGEQLSQKSLRVIGLVVDKVDKIMHGMHLGTAGMHNQVGQWGQEGFLARLLEQLTERGFTVFLTADHGNIEAVGCGRPAEGAAAEQRGERARIYSDAGLRTRVGERFPDATLWPPIGLPDDFLPLLAPTRAAFVREGERVVAHGGISLEEIVVPLVRVDAYES